MTIECKYCNNKGVYYICRDESYVISRPEVWVCDNDKCILKGFKEHINHFGYKQR